MKWGPIKQAIAMEDGILCVVFVTGNSVIVDMKPSFQGFRFGILKNPKVWNTLDTDGRFVYWYKEGSIVSELAYNEIMKMTLGESY